MTAADRTPRDSGSFKLYPKLDGEPLTAAEIKRGLYVLYMDYECPCGKNQSVAQMGGIGGNCIACGRAST